MGGGQDLDQPAKSQNLIRTFASNRDNLQYPTNPQADSEDPDQTALAQSDLGLRYPHMPRRNLFMLSDSYIK